jgi:hypothetical protein
MDPYKLEYEIKLSIKNLGIEDNKNSFLAVVAFTIDIFIHRLTIIKCKKQHTVAPT